MHPSDERSATRGNPEAVALRLALAAAETHPEARACAACGESRRRSFRRASRAARGHQATRARIDRGAPAPRGPRPCSGSGARSEQRRARDEPSVEALAPVGDWHFPPWPATSAMPVEFAGAGGGGGIEAFGDPGSGAASTVDRSSGRGRAPPRRRATRSSLRRPRAPNTRARSRARAEGGAA